jgi:hypothetical protein
MGKSAEIHASATRNDPSKACRSEDEAILKSGKKGPCVPLRRSPAFSSAEMARARPAELMRRHPFGRIAFANSDLSGIMDHRPSITEADRAVEHVLSLS